MAKERPVGGATGSAGAANSNLYVEAGETVVLTPDSQRFGGVYKRLHPSSIDEVRSILGLSDAAAEALSAKGSCQRSCVPTGLHSPEDLLSHDKALERRAKEMAITAARQYVTGANPEALAQWKPLIDRYLEIGKVVINYVVLHDIEVADGGTLVVSANTHGINANNIKIHGSGRIVCRGSVSINCATLQGFSTVIKHPHVPVAQPLRA